MARLALLLALSLAGCDEIQPLRPDGGALFIALTRDFVDFRSWQRFEIDTPAVPVGHPEGPTFVYLNEMPPEGVRRFPVGTILVKTIEPATPQEWAIHAMVKRSSDFGVENGTVGWEFFELRFDEDEVPVILWRGPGPPTGMGYRLSTGTDAGVVELVCSDCHAPAWQNDSVINAHTRLSY